MYVSYLPFAAPDLLPSPQTLNLSGSPGSCTDRKVS